MNDELSAAQLVTVREEYVLVRDDDRHGSTVVVSYLTGLVAVHAAIFAVYAQDSYRSELHDGYKGLIPLVSIGLAGMFLHRAANEVVRSHYLRSLEAILYAAEGVRITDVDGRGTVPVPGLANITHEVQKPRTRNFELGALAGAGVALFFGVILASSMYALVMMESNWTRAMFAIIYLAMFSIILRVGWSTGYAGHTMWRTAVQGADRRLNRVPSERRSLSLAKYCLLPRPLEVLTKGVLMGVCGMTGGILVLLANRQPLPEAWPVLTGYAAFELLLYQARYMINDVVGMVGDRSHPSALERRRIPLTGNTGRDAARRHVVLMVSAGRIALFALCLFLLPSPISNRLLSATVVLVACSILYDIARYPFQRGTHSVQDWRARIWPFVTLGSIGVGYAVRGTLAVALVAGDVPRMGWLIAFLYLAGTASVWMSWAVNSFDFISRNSSLPAPSVDRRIEGSPHVRLLGEHAGFIDRHASAGSQLKDADLLAMSESPYLVEKTRFGHVWDLVAVGSTVAALVYGLAFAESEVRLSLLVVSGYVAAGMAGVTASLWRHQWARWIGVPLALLGFGALLVGGAAWQHALAATYPVLLSVSMAAAYLGLTPRIAKTDIMIILGPVREVRNRVLAVLQAAWRELSGSGVPN